MQENRCFRLARTKFFGDGCEVFVNAKKVVDKICEMGLYCFRQPETAVRLRARESDAAASPVCPAPCFTR